MEKLFTYKSHRNYSVMTFLFTFPAKLFTLIAAASFAAACLTGCGNRDTGDGSDASSSGTAQSRQILDTLQSPQETDTSQMSQGSENFEASQNPLAAENTVAALSGSLQMAGSTSMEKYVNALAESFMEKHPNVSVTVEFVGSGAGIEAVTAGTADIGNSSRNLKDGEKKNGAVENIVAIDGIAVCGYPKSTVANLTKPQLIDIYIGAVTNWSELGGADMPIVVVGRESGSGSRSAFEEILGVEDMCDYANELDSSGAVLAKVASTPGAIGYISLDVMDDSVIALSLDGAGPTADNIREGSYFLSRPFVMATKGAISEQDELVQAWFGYVYSEEGQEIASQAGLITVQ